MEETELASARESIELMSLANEFNSLGGTYFAMYITLVSGYLVTAYLAGTELTRGQLRLVNSIFVLSSLYFLWSTMSMWFAGVSLYFEAAPEVWTMNLYFTVGLNALLSVAMLIGIIACLQFMHGVRRRGNPAD